MFTLTHCHSIPVAHLPPESSGDSEEVRYCSNYKLRHRSLKFISGRHPCLGRRIAELVLKVYVDMLFAGYEFSITDDMGKPLKQIPKQRKNTFHASPLEEGLAVRLQIIPKANRADG